MKKLSTLIFFISMVTQVHSQCANPVNIHSFTYNGKNYEVVKEFKTWAAAAACAVERGGHLVEINDSGEQSAVYNAIINGAGVAPNYVQVPNGGNIAYVWIGATDQANEGVWLWDGNSDGQGIHFWSGQGANGSGDGAPVNNAYHNWGGKSTGTPNEPDNWSGQHHGAIGLQDWPSGSGHLGKASEWNDIIGSSQLYYVIEGSTTTSVDESTFNPNEIFNIYPNPTTGIVFIKDAYKYVEVFDNTGRILLKQKSGNEINLSSLASNVYFIRISNITSTEVKKVVVQMK